jgi:hypothetical protein
MVILRIIFFSLALICSAYSSLCLFKPGKGIKAFQAWCRYLNWKVEPIHYDVEIRSTRKFGLVGLILSLILLFKIIFM